jgi:hypothetical protein
MFHLAYGSAPKWQSPGSSGFRPLKREGIRHLKANQCMKTEQKIAKLDVCLIPANADCCIIYEARKSTYSFVTHITQHRYCQLTAVRND